MSKDSEQNIVSESQIIAPIEKLLELIWSGKIVSSVAKSQELSSEFDLVMSNFLKLSNYDQLKIWNTKIENSKTRAEKNKFMEGKTMPEIFKAIRDIKKTMDTAMQSRARFVFDSIEKWEGAVYKAVAATKSDPNPGLNSWNNMGARHFAGEFMVPLSRMLTMVLDMNNSYSVFEVHNKQFGRLKEKFLEFPRIIQDEICAAKIDPAPFDGKLKSFLESGKQSIPDILIAFDPSSELIKNFLKGREENVTLFLTSLHDISDFGKELGMRMAVVFDVSNPFGEDVSRGKAEKNKNLLLTLQRQS